MSMNNLQQQNEILDAARAYLRQGLSIIPLNGKQPRISWTQYQHKLPTPEEIEAWFSQPGANIGLVTGSISGVVVVDFDKKHNRSSDEFPSIPTVYTKTGGGGEHLFFQHPGFNVPSKNGIYFGVGIDVKADGGIIVLPPSIHPESGIRYEAVVPFSRESLAACPDWLLAKIERTETLPLANAKSKKNWQEATSTPIAEGTRYENLSSIMGKILHQLSPELWDTAGWSAITGLNQKLCLPPQPEDELRKSFEALKKKALKSKAASDSDGKKAVEKFIQALKEDSELFHDEYKEPYIRIQIENHQEIWSLKSEKFKHLVNMRFYETHQRTLSNEMLKSSISTLIGEAIFHGKEHHLFNRVGALDGDIWVDLSNREHQAVKITAEGWEVISTPPILLKRYSHQKAQVQPLKGGDVTKFLNYVNIPNPHQRLLLLVFLISSFVPDIPHPIPVIFGSQGSAKSTLSKLLRKVIDPSVIEVSSFPRNPDDVVQALSHNWFMFFDNVSQISEHVSDLFCKVITGAGFTKRELYTNDEDVIYSFRRIIGINGINLAATRPDLLERSILLQLDRIPENQRKQERDLIRDFENDLPSILGGAFDVLSRAMAIYPTIDQKSLPRMADFAAYGCAIAEAIGAGAASFVEAYQSNILEQNDEVLSQDPIAVVLRYFFESRSEWTGTASALLKELSKISWNVGINSDTDRDWPKTANYLTRRINNIRVNLAKDGLDLTYSREYKSRILHFTNRNKLNEFEDVEPPTSSDPGF